MISKQELITPEFLFCEIPIKDNTFNDNRIWIYSVKSLSLIEFINVDDLVDFNFPTAKYRFEYQNSDGNIEDYFAVFTQNNCEYTGNDADQIMQKSWKFLSDYLRWEDGNIDESDNIILN